MDMLLRIGEFIFKIDANCGASLARPLDFAVLQSDFGAAPPTRRPVQIGSFVGDTTQGAGCNVDELTIVPHCHGTHTETVGHIVDNEVTIAAANLPTWMVAALVTVPDISAERSRERYVPAPMPGDRLITAESLETGWNQLSNQIGYDSLLELAQSDGLALVVRLANQNGRNESDGALKERGDTQEPKAVSTILPPYFSSDAIEWCNRLRVRHMLIEFPSIDRLEDDGLLSNHHLFWNVPAETHSLTPDCWPEKSITESITVGRELGDGFYLLNLQVPRFCSDAAPSNPVLHPLVYVEGSTGGNST